MPERVASPRRDLYADVTQGAPASPATAAGLVVHVATGGGSGGGTGGDGAIVDGVSSAIKATVKDYVNSNPLAAVLVDSNGDPYVAAGASGLTDAQLRATAVPVSVSGVATEVTLASVNTHLSNLKKAQDAASTGTDNGILALGIAGNPASVAIGDFVGLKTDVDGSLYIKQASAPSLVLDSQAGASPATATWTSATALNTDVSSGNGYAASDALVSALITPPLTGGQITFEVSPDGSTWLPVAGLRLSNGQAESTYSLNGAASEGWQVKWGPFDYFRVRLSQAITGAGSVTIWFQGYVMPTTPRVTAALAPGTNSIGAVTGPLTDAQLRATPVPVSGTVTANVGTGTQPVSGTVTANAGTGPFPVSDNAGSLTVDAPVGTPVFTRLSDGSAALVGQKAMTASLPVTVASDQSAVPVSGTVTANVGTGTQPVSGTVTANAGTGPFPVSDNAGSLTVDAPVGTPVFARLSDGTAALIGQKAMAASLPVTVASDQSAVPVSGTVSVNALPTGTNNIGDVDVLTLPALPAGTNRIGSVRVVDSADADQTAVKGTQTSRFLGAQLSKDAGRSQVMLAWEEMAGTAAAESALTNFTLGSRAGSALSAATNLQVTAGKTLRIEAVNIYIKATSTVNNLARFRIRMAGTVANTSPVIWDAVLGHEVTGTLAAGLLSNQSYALPDGLEVAAAQQIAFTWFTSAATCTVGMTIIGFEY